MPTQINKLRYVGYIKLYNSLSQLTDLKLSLNRNLFFPECGVSHVRQA